MCPNGEYVWRKGDDIRIHTRVGTNFTQLSTNYTNFTAIKRLLTSLLCKIVQHIYEISVRLLSKIIYLRNRSFGLWAEHSKS